MGAAILPGGSGPSATSRHLLSTVAAAFASNESWAITYVGKLRNAYGLMRCRTDALGLVGQSNIHNAAQASHRIHRSGWFLPWHRGMLYFHERILGALLNDPNFRLPVWDWDSANGQRPPRFLTDGTQFNCSASTGNSLFDSTRTLIGMPPTQQLILSQWKDLVVQRSFNLFGGSFNGIHNAGKTGVGESFGNPHAAFHNWVGGNMADLGTAGLDPLFYMHHANIDRLWAHRQYVGSQPGMSQIEDLATYINNPNDALLAKEFNFTDCTGNPGSVVAIQRKLSIRDLAKISNLGYDYPSYPNIQVQPNHLNGTLSLFDSVSHNQWKMMPSPLHEPLQCSLAVEFPHDLGGEVDLEIRVGDKLVPVGSCGLVAHHPQITHHHPDHEHGYTVFVRASIPSGVLKQLMGVHPLTGRWVSKKYGSGDMPILEINIMQADHPEAKAAQKF